MLTSLRRRPFLMLLTLAAVVAAAAVAWTRRHWLLAVIAAGVGDLSRMGPWAYFGAMAVLPALGVPSTVFTVTAGSAFGSRLGMAWVMAAGVAAIAFNIALTYILARWVLRGWLQRILERFGYRIPTVEGGDATDLIVALRVTTGVPFCVQNYLLGLVDAPAGRFFGLSYLLSLPTGAAYIWFGDALLHGRGKMILWGIGLIALLTVGTHFLRRHYAARRAEAG